ncbi:MAG: hypothetical protein AAGG08_01680, partial [Actinomycetota bacterium]
MAVIDVVSPAPASPVRIHTIVARAGRPLPCRQTGAGRLCWSDDVNVAVVFDGRAVVIGPRRALWLPPACDAAASVDGQIWTAVFEAPVVDVVAHRPAAGILELDDVLVAALRELAHSGPDDSVAVAGLLIDRIATSLDGDLDAPLRPSDELARRVADSIISDPADRRGLDWWATELAI